MPTLSDLLGLGLGGLSNAGAAQPGAQPAQTYQQKLADMLKGPQNPVVTQYRQPDQKLLAGYARTYPFLAQALSNPSALMKIIDTVHARESTLSPGSAPDFFAARVAKSALSDLYGVNDYTPRGFMRYDEGQNQWNDPRTSAPYDTEQGKK